MTRASGLSPAQQADLAERRRDGRPDIAAMSNEERRQAGLMDRRQAAEHERLATLPHVRLAERVRGPQPDDIWATDEHEAWRQSVQGAWEAAGHYERSCGGWLDDVHGNVICATCLEAVPLPEGETAA